MTNNQPTKPKRVLHILVTLNLGGAESRVMDLFRNQDPALLIHDFAIMTPEKCYYSDEVAKANGVVHVVRNPRESLFGHIIDLYRVFTTQPQYNAVHAHTSFHAGLCLLLAKIAGIKARISHARNTSTSTPSIFVKAMLLLGRSLIRYSSTHRYAISNDAGNYLYGKTNFEVIPNAFNYQLIKHKSETTDSEKAALGIPQALNIVAVARFYPVKNHAFMLKVVDELKKVRSDVVLHLIGDGELKEEISRAANKLGLSQNVVFWGRRNDVYQLLPYFDVMLMPSITEGLGVAALEAQKAGVPCLVSDALPVEADINAGLFYKLSINEPPKLWAERCLSLIEVAVPSKEGLDTLFEQKGYSLKYSEEKFYKAYCYDG
ncbi:glycosyltransferase [Thalassotalea sp. LPB0316]|uniref:glycosyltransferase n=1 Tax=Thalassotalea sp. LPB0316 TaxID=2769490 RepID=UPI001866996C|nr:glycosyltransferase [Thalassotalea sp. LPB0316]QOL26572.1 glycosyltransferase [Thalassotalea sp. LPB0316]